jgi:hypothetical protein
MLSGPVGEIIEAIRDRERPVEWIVIGPGRRAREQSVTVEIEYQQ